MSVPVGLLLIQLALLVAAMDLALRLGPARTSPGTSAFTRRELACLIALLVAAAAIRLPYLEDCPAGAESDEFVVASTVQDLCNPDPRHLDRVEPYFESWASGSTRLAAWLVRLREAVNPATGVEAAGSWPPPRGLGTLRLANALCGLGLVGVLYVLLRVLDGPIAALGGAGLAAMAPVFVRQSRLALQAVDFSLLPLTAFLLFVLAFRSASRGRRWALLAGAGGLLGLGVRLWVGFGALPAALACAGAALLVCGRRERWSGLWRATIPAAAGFVLVAWDRVGVPLGILPDSQLGQTALTTLATDPWMVLIVVAWGNLLLAGGCLLGLLPVASFQGPILPFVVPLVAVVGLFCPCRTRVRWAGMLGAAFLVGGLAPAAASRSDPVGLQSLGAVLPLMFVAAGLGLSALREALPEEARLRACVLPGALVLATSPWSWLDQGPIALPVPVDALVAPVREASRLTPWFTVHYSPAHFRTEQAFQLDARACKYLEWAYGLEPLTPGIWMPHHPMTRPPAVLISSVEMRRALADMFAAGGEVKLSLGGTPLAVFFMPFFAVENQQGWMGPERTEPTDPGPAVWWWKGMVKIPAADLYAFRVHSPGTPVSLRVGRAPVLTGPGFVETAGWFLEGYCPIAAAVIVDEPTTAPLIAWSRGDQPEGQWWPVPPTAIRKAYWEAPLDSSPMVSVRSTAEILTMNDMVLPAPRGNTFESALLLEDSAYWVHRWLPCPLWRYSMEGQPHPSAPDSAVSTYRTQLELESAKPPTALEADGHHLILPVANQKRLVYLAADSPDRRSWPASPTLSAPVSLARWSDGGNLAVGSGDGVQVVDWSGRLLRRWQLRTPADLTVGADGELVALDPFHARIRVFDSFGKELNRWRVGELTPASRVRADNRGRLWVLLPEQGDLLVFSPEGKLLTPLRHVVSPAVHDTRGKAHREERPGDLDAAQDGTVYVLLDGHLQQVCLQ
ncbi:MAG: hypothetical protein HY814_11275 [Candidatus Riflebacteria bacterium]|nr:hypothetical protein [Candidatus Riflebacteria bacterium]